MNPIGDVVQTIPTPGGKRFVVSRIGRRRGQKFKDKVIHNAGAKFGSCFWSYPTSFHLKVKPLGKEGDCLIHISNNIRYVMDFL
jgi:hypothetical protein